MAKLVIRAALFPARSRNLHRTGANVAETEDAGTLPYAPAGRPRRLRAALLAHVLASYAVGIVPPLVAAAVSERWYDTPRGVGTLVVCAVLCPLWVPLALVAVWMLIWERFENGGRLKGFRQYLTYLWVALYVALIATAYLLLRRGDARAHRT